MVYWTAVKAVDDVDPNSVYANESMRARNHYKELHVHNAPPRKNKDFKPMLYGDFRGMLNFKLAEPWGHLRHLPDIFNEEHNFVIRLARRAIEGGTVGFAYGLFKFVVSDLNSYTSTKSLLLNQSSKLGNFTMAKHVFRSSLPYVYRGSMVWFAYNFLVDFFNHHKQAQDKPQILQHLKAWLVLSPLLIATYVKPAYIVNGTICSALLVFPLFYMLVFDRSQRKDADQAYYFYQDGVSQAEKDKFEHMDAIEAVGHSAHSEFMHGNNRYKNIRSMNPLF